MPLRLLRAVSAHFSEGWPPAPARHTFSVNDLVWAMGSFCALNRKPFDSGLLIRQFPPPYNTDSFIHAGRALGFRIKRKDCPSQTVGSLNLPCLVIMKVKPAVADGDAQTITDIPVHTTRP